MSDTPIRGGDPAARVAEYVLRMIPAGQSVHEWCEARGIDDRMISRWKTKGGDIKVGTARDLASALGLTLGQVLVVAGYVKQRDMEGAPPPKPTPPPPPTVADAIERDPSLNEHEREVLRNILAMFPQVRAGRGGTRRRGI